MSRIDFILSDANPLSVNAFSHLSFRELSFCIITGEALALWPDLCKVASGFSRQVA